MYRPEGDIAHSAIAQQIGAVLLQPPADTAGYLTGQVHLEPLVADMPRNEVSATRDDRCMEPVEREAGGFRRYQTCPAAITEQQKAEHLLQLPLFLQMQAGEFEIDHQDLGVGFR